jgi:hypothetical protein
MANIPEHLASTHYRDGVDICRNANCPQAVKRDPLAPIGGWYITMDHPGFNSPENNALGYDRESDARKDIASYARK